jgi:acetyl/propionyl-CoA carboxylase alpha subunit
MDSQHNFISSRSTRVSRWNTHHRDGHGIDLVNAQLLLAASGCLTLRQEQIRMHGTAIEARVIAEDPDQSFMPTSGQITYLSEPAGSGIRVDSALYQGMAVTTDYDSLIAKLIVWVKTAPLPSAACWARWMIFKSPA